MSLQTITRSKLSIFFPIRLYAFRQGVIRAHEVSHFGSTHMDSADIYLCSSKKSIMTEWFFSWRTNFLVKGGSLLWAFANIWLLIPVKVKALYKKSSAIIPVVINKGQNMSYNAHVYAHRQCEREWNYWLIVWRLVVSQITMAHSHLRKSWP